VFDRVRSAVWFPSISSFPEFWSLEIFFFAVVVFGDWFLLSHEFALEKPQITISLI